METRKALLTDFDGTLTNVAGGALVFTQHYHDVTSTPDRDDILKKNRAEADSIREQINALNHEKTLLTARLKASIDAGRHSDPLTTSYVGENLAQEFEIRQEQHARFTAETDDQ